MTPAIGAFLLLGIVGGVGIGVGLYGLWLKKHGRL